MFVSSPVSQICLALAPQFKEEEDMIECLDLLHEISTNHSETGVTSFNDKLTTFLRNLQKDKHLIYYTAAFTTYYFELRDNKELADIFNKLMIDYSNYTKRISEYNAGYLSGVYSTALMSDIQLNYNDNIPETIKQAIKYIESENYIVHLEKLKE